MQDLSSLCHGLTGGESMIGGNMISTPPPFGAPGSVSEQTAREPVGEPAGVDYGEPRPPSVLVSGNDSPSPSPWTAADGSPWMEASPDISAGNAAHGRWEQA